MEAAILIGVLVVAVIVFLILKNKKPQNKIASPAPVQEELPKKLEVVKPLQSDQAFKKIIEVESAPISEVVVADAQPAAAPVAAEELVTLKVALKNTEESFFGRIKKLFTNEDSKKNLDEIEEILYTSDLGPQTVQRLMESLQSTLSRSEKGQLELVKESLRSQLLDIFEHSQKEFVTSNEEPLERLQFAKEGPTLWMIVGVNGAGKTTTIGKLANQLAKNGKKVLIAAGDTFRAAAGGQLKVWADRAQVDIYSPEGVTDPSAVAFDAVSKAKAGGYDVVIVDTAGRLHTQQNLMEEIKKMKRVVQKVIADGPHETLIVLDANQGQNALQQCREFNNALGLSGVILTKLDGTAKGGVAVGVAHEIKLPIKLIGVGEKIHDLRVFNVKEFVEAIL